VKYCARLSSKTQIAPAHFHVLLAFHCAIAGLCGQRFGGGEGAGVGAFLESRV